MLGRASAIWFGIMLVAILNGAFRDIVLVPPLGDPIARALSSVTLAGGIFLIASLTLRWIQPASSRDAWVVGVTWLAMTLAFEFLAGHYVFHTPWAALFADYNILEGRLWVLVPIATLTAPALVYGASPITRWLADCL